MGKKCFVPGCKTGYCSQINKGKRHSLFKPCNPQQLENWRKVIPRADKLITPNDCVCELHFNDEDIDRYYETTIFDGTNFKLLRGRPMLKKNAIPTIFSSLPGYSNKIAKIVKKMKSVNESTTYNPPSPVIKPIETNHSELEESLNIDVNESSNNEVEGHFTPDNEVEENFTFSELAKNLHWISTPNIFWGITAHDMYIMCARWDENYALKKRVVIDHDLKVKVYLKDADFSLENADVKNFEEISSLLEIVESFELNS